MNIPGKRFITSAYGLIIIVLLSIGAIFNPGYAAEEPGNDASCIQQEWPHEHTNLQPDPAVHFGTLDNGFRYVIMKNSEPENRVGLYLNIQAGSLNEQDEQRGLAHFLEHMLFNGTTNYPPGTLIEYFQSIGMSFGADTNAMTNFNATVYNILLPDGNREHLNDGLQVMADYARGALLLEDEVDRERGIILAEKRTRDSADYRLYKAKTRFFFAGTRIPERLPIGTEETLKNADSDLLRDFYDTWYRPENMVLIVVGDVKPELVSELIEKYFARFENPSREPSCYSLGAVNEKGVDVLYVHEPELGHTEISINTRWNETPEKDTLAVQKRKLKEYVAESILANRLKKIVNQPDSPITSGQTYSGIFLQQIGYASITAQAKAGMWRQALELLDITLRQAIEDGFTPDELERVKKDINAELEKQVMTKNSRDSRKLAREIIGKLNQNEVILSPEQEERLYAPVLELLTVEDVNQVFRELWSHDNRQLFVGGTEDLSGEIAPEKLIRNVYADSRKKEIPQWKNGKAFTFPYLQVPQTPGKITEDLVLDDIQARQVQFENGTVLHFKQTDFQPNEVMLSVHFGKGRFSEPAEGLAMLSRDVVQESGSGTLTKSQLDEALAGSSARLRFDIGEESFTLSGSALTEEFEQLMQLVQTQLLDPGFREDAYRLARERLEQMYDQLGSSVDGMMRLYGERFLAGGSQYFGMPSREEFSKLTLHQVEQWLAPIFADAQLEVNVVGDIALEKVLDITGRYLGTLERKKGIRNTNVNVDFPAGEKLTREVATQIDKALVVIAWETDDLWDISRTRRLNVLSSIFDDRLRVEIREKLGAVYSPVVYNKASRVVDGYGVLHSILTVDPAQADVVADKVLEVGANLVNSGVSQEELQRALEPTLTSIKDMMRTNRYWLETVLALSSRHPEQLKWPLTIQSDFASITPQDVEKLAQRYLQPDNSAELLFEPEMDADKEKGLTDKP